MVAPYVVEEYDGKFWIHKGATVSVVNGRPARVRGELACKTPFDSQHDAQLKANKMEAKTGVLW